MAEFTIECTMCSGSFGSEKEYSDHRCIDDGVMVGSVRIKQEPAEENQEYDSELTTDHCSSNSIGVEVKSELLDNDSYAEFQAEEDPLSFVPTDLLTVKQESPDEVEVERYHDTSTNVAPSSASLVDTVEEDEVRNVASALSLKCISKYNCKLCGATFTKKDKFSKHFRENHNSYRPYECNVCKKKFLHKHYVNLHMRVHTGEKPYECQLCPKAYSHKTSFTIHMRIHNGDRPYMCNVCGKRCYDKSGLTSHMRSHTKETPYQCEVCGRRFTHSKSLLVHRRNHTGEKPYICSFCGKAFRHWHKHKIHVRLHTGERPYKCKVCNKGFPRNDEVARHMRSHQGIKSFKCSICGVYCATQASITGHINLHHSNLKCEDIEQPEKTLVKDGMSGILGTKVPEPRSIYRKFSMLSDSNTSNAVIPSTSLVTTTVQSSQSSTRVIEVTSKDTPFTLQKKFARRSLNLEPAVMPKSRTVTSPNDTDETKPMNYKEFLAWQERMLTNQGLVVKGYSESKSQNLNSSSEVTRNGSSSATTGNVSKPCAIRTTVSTSALSQSQPRPQYLLLTQGEGPNATRILLPLHIANTDPKNKNVVVSSRTVPHMQLAKPVSNVVTQPRSKPMNMVQQPGMKNQPAIFLSHNSGQKLFILAPQNGQPGINAALPTSPNIKRELEDGDCTDGLSSTPMNVTIKTEPGLTCPTAANCLNIPIKQEPD